MQLEAAQRLHGLEEALVAKAAELERARTQLAQAEQQREVAAAELERMNSEVRARHGPCV